MSETSEVADIDASELGEIERIAVELATLAGAEIKAALGSMIAVRYKGESPEKTLWRDPVSEIDQRVEGLIRVRVAERFPSHDVIGEEMVERLGRTHDYVWTVDPIDGTTNFVNGFPMFAASIGVLRRGRPVVGAVWCSTGHALRPGVYHACVGSKLRFEDNDVTPKLNPAVRRRRAGCHAERQKLGDPQDRLSGNRMRLGCRRHVACCSLREPEHLGCGRRHCSGRGGGRCRPSAARWKMGNDAPVRA